MSVKSVARIIGSVVAIAAIAALYFLDRSELPSWVNLWWAIGTAVVAAIVMFIITPSITVVPYRWMRETSATDLIAAGMRINIGIFLFLVLVISIKKFPPYLWHFLS